MAPVRVMRVLEALSIAKDGMSLAGLSSELAVPKTSALQLLRALEIAGYVRRTPAGFVLGAASYGLAARIGGADDVERAIFAVMQEVVDSTQETILIGTFTDGAKEAIYTKRIPSPLPVRFAPEIGDPRPLYASGIGKLLLAYAPADFLEAYLSSTKLEPVTAKTVTTKKLLKERLTAVRAAGFAVSIDELAEGGSAVVAPIFDATGRVEKALVLAAPTARFLVNQSRYVSAVCAGAERIAVLNGYRDEK
ncbi:IclR family transcriptional regulator [Cupriavidus pauculus]|uniref:IclR family transcriptional regulator n=1 Tax=Cupriavidus pauculus TaxID=82633 RepID=UPI001FD4F436|nr:IclR family transcriptional regulator [Cupriavidus pauculus]